MGISLRGNGGAVQWAARDLCAVWREVVGPFSPILLTPCLEDVDGLSVVLAVEAPSQLRAVIRSDDTLSTAEAMALEWIRAGLVPRALWRVPMAPMDRLLALLPGVSQGEIDSVLHGVVELQTVSSEIQTVLASGSKRGAYLLEMIVATKARADATAAQEPKP